MYANTTKFNSLSREQRNVLYKNALRHYQAMEDFDVRCKSGKVVRCHIYISQFDEGYAAFDVTGPKHKRITEWSGLNHFRLVAAYLYGYAMEN